MFRRHLNPAGRLRLGVVLVVVAAALGVLFFNLVSPSPPAVSDASVFGVNMSLYNPSDHLVDDMSVQRLLESWHVPLVRLTLRPTLSDATLHKALRAISAMGATPVVVIPGPDRSSNPDGLGGRRLLELDLHDVALVEAVFGQGTVYLEYGNEPDNALSGGASGSQEIDAGAYTRSWNAVMPTVRAHVPSAYRMVGPVVSYANASYIATFLAGANPRPDLVSWHVYACRAPTSQQACTANVASWTTQVENVNAAERAAIGTSLPFLLTEWNADPASTAADSAFYADDTFITAWTARAIAELKSLIPLGLRGAAIYTATDHGNFALVGSNGQPTAQGRAFRAAATAQGS